MSEMMEREENETTVEFLALIAARRHARAGRHNSWPGGDMQGRQERIKFSSYL